MTGRGKPPSSSLLTTFPPALSPYQAKHSAETRAPSRSAGPRPLRLPAPPAAAAAAPPPPGAASGAAAMAARAARPPPGRHRRQRVASWGGPAPELSAGTALRVPTGGGGACVRHFRLRHFSTSLPAPLSTSGRWRTGRPQTGTLRLGAPFWQPLRPVRPALQAQPGMKEPGRDAAYETPHRVGFLSRRSGPKSSADLHRLRAEPNRARAERSEEEPSRPFKPPQGAAGGAGTEPVGGGRSSILRHLCTSKNRHLR